MSEHSEFKRLAEAATPGPWIEQDDEDSAAGAVFIIPVADRYVQPICRITHEANAAFIAAANPAAVLELIAESQHLAELLECAQGDCRQAMQIMEKLTPQADLYQQVQIAAGSLPHGWEITLRIENGYGGVDLIDPYGTVVDLDNVDESLSESVASAVAFAMSKEG